MHYLPHQRSFDGIDVPLGYVPHGRGSKLVERNFVPFMLPTAATTWETTNNNTNKKRTRNKNKNKEKDKNNKRSKIKKWTGLNGVQIAKKLTPCLLYLHVQPKCIRLVAKETSAEKYQSHSRARQENQFKRYEVRDTRYGIRLQGFDSTRFDSIRLGLRQNNQDPTDCSYNIGVNLAHYPFRYDLHYRE